jgi:hypothetical protein
MSDIYLQITETPAVVTLSAPVVASVMVNTVTVANVVSVNVVTMPSISIQTPSVTTVIGTVTIGNFPATQAVSLASVPTHGVTLASTTVTVSSLPAISGTVTANLSSFRTLGQSGNSGGVLVYGSDSSGNCYPIPLTAEGSLQVLAEIASLPSVEGSVFLQEGTAQIGSVTASISGTVPVSGTFWQATQPVSGTFFQATQPVSGTFWQATQPVSLASTTVTISANPAGPLTTRFGSVTTANTSQLTTAVTNTAREYLFIQNISTGSVTVGVGFSPTTTQGIQLSPGSGITFDSFCPTGAVWWLGATTGAAWTILEG